MGRSAPGGAAEEEEEAARLRYCGLVMAEEEGLEDGLAAAEADGSLARLVGEVVAAAAAAGLFYLSRRLVARDYRACAVEEEVRWGGQERVRRPRRRI